MIALAIIVVLLAARWPARWPPRLARGPAPARRGRGGVRQCRAGRRPAGRVEWAAGRVHALSGFCTSTRSAAFFLLTVALVVAARQRSGRRRTCGPRSSAGELSRLQVRLYFIFFAIFAAMMLASFETGNLGLLWVLIEASTLASCVLVGLEGKPVSLEAAWKYIIISSFGVTIALVGTLFLYFAASNLQLARRPSS